MTLLNLAAKVKVEPSRYSEALKGRVLGLLFEKPSLRTKSSFYVAALKTGADAVYFSPQEVRLGERESVTDVARTISRYFDCIVIRTFSHDTILDFVKASTIPVINGLSDLFHPTQAVADIFTIYESKKELKKVKCAYIGDGNNVCHSLMYAFSMLGGNLHIASPRGYGPQKDILEEVRRFSKVSGATIVFSNDPQGAAVNADVIYTDVWTSMGKEDEKKGRMKAFKQFQVNSGMMKLTKRDCIVMHCLPAHRGEEITDEVLESKNSVVFLQAENRLHTAKAIMLGLLGGTQWER